MTKKLKSNIDKHHQVLVSIKPWYEYIGNAPVLSPEVLLFSTLLYQAKPFTNYWPVLRLTTLTSFPNIYPTHFKAVGEDVRKLNEFYQKPREIK